jgi:bifunctional DNase/RNase
MVEMQLFRIVIRETSDQQYIYLREKDGSRQFPIVIGYNEASAIDRRVRDREMPRPMTHDLMAAVVRATGHALARVVVCELRNNTFYARLELAPPGGGPPVEVDARPSDAIALAVHLDAPIFVADEVLDAVVTSPTDEP